MKLLNLILSTFILSSSLQLISQELPKGSSWTVIEGEGIKVHTYMSPTEMFANASHIIELKNELIIVDGQLFAPYAQELKAFTDNLDKPVSRFYISHDHADHYMGFGDAFPNATVYALKETKEVIEKEGQTLLTERQKQFGPLMAKKLNIPSVEQALGEEIISDVKFIFEKSEDNEAAVSLIIKVPSVGVYIAQDIVYNKVHLFISGDTKGWENALNKILIETDYNIVLCGHGKDTGKSIVVENLMYLAFVNDSIESSKDKEEYKSKILANYPNYSGVGLVDLYLNYYLKPGNWQ